ncbi:hypothetical protein [Kosmotoga pacifica]|uniref:Uncharacterized protein n=1 Tax=Kosmotoga pacifica TaxID=1330330 RepID=A0A0G2ZFA9_9BACT|nr:hypothetical protein [Kosmotoga pacifica]AKI97453.1 hypothetical protein IX53_06055 [Kosmotoga pacifica]
MIDRYLVYYLAVMVLVFTLNSMAREYSILALFPICIIFVYFLGNGKFLPKILRKRIEIFLNGGYLFNDIDAAVSRLEKNEKLELNELKENIESIKKRLLSIAKVQRKLFLFSLILAPIFPILGTYASMEFEGMKKILLLVSGYGGMFAVIFFSIAGINAFFKQIKQIADRIDSVKKD